MDTGIQRANLDGTEVESLVSMGISDPRGIALDASRGKIYAIDVYASEAKPDEIRRFNLDGSGGEVLALEEVYSISAVALDVTAGKLYWTDPDTAKIQQANLDGSGVEDLLTGADGLVSPQGIAVDVAAGKLY